LAQGSKSKVNSNLNSTSSVNHKTLSGYEARLVGQKEKGGANDILWNTQTPERGTVKDLPFLCLIQIPRHFRIVIARDDGVYADVFLT